MKNKYPRTSSVEGLGDVNKQTWLILTSRRLGQLKLGKTEVGWVKFPKFRDLTR